MGVVKRITAVGKTYFPEVTASATLINAPAGVETLWRGVSVFLNAAMRAKVRIVGRDYREALTDHAKIDDYDLLDRAQGCFCLERRHDLRGGREVRCGALTCVEIKFRASHAIKRCAFRGRVGT